MQTEAILKKVEMFGGLSTTQLSALSKVVVLRVIAAGEILFLQDDQAAGFYIVVDGGLQVYRTGMDGRRQILHVFTKPGDVCGEVAVFEGGEYPAAAEAVGSTTVLYVPRDTFLRLARAEPDMLLAMLAVLCRRLRRFVGLIDDLSLKDVGARLARYLVDRAEEAGKNVIRLTISKGMLASQLGTIAETVSRTLRKMQEQGLIAVDGREIRILDREGLEGLAEG